MAEFDLTPRLLPFMDRHMLLPLLEFLEDKQLYTATSLLSAKLTFANSTKMLNLYAAEYARLAALSAPGAMPAEPPQLEARKQEIYTELHQLQAALGPLLPLLQDEVSEDGATLLRPAEALALREAGSFTVEHLAATLQISLEQVELLYAFAKLNFEIGRYREAADYLFYYRELIKSIPSAASVAAAAAASPDAAAPSSELVPDTALAAQQALHNYWALWGKCAGEILMANMEVAYNDLSTLAQTLEQMQPAPDQLEALQQRTWLLHWSLFIFFNVTNGRNLLIEFFMQEKMMNTIQVNAPHLLRYLCVAIVLNRRRKTFLKDLIKCLTSSQAGISLPFVASSSSSTSVATFQSSPSSPAVVDPIIDFILAVHVDFDFKRAKHDLDVCRSSVLKNDFFLAGNLEKEFIEQARVMLFEVFCAVHSRVGLKPLATQVDLSSVVSLDKDGEIVIPNTDQPLATSSKDKKKGDDEDAILVSIIRACHVSAKIDSYNDELLFVGEQHSIYSQVMHRTNNATFRTLQLAGAIQKRLVAKKQTELNE